MSNTSELEKKIKAKFKLGEAFSVSNENIGASATAAALPSKAENPALFTKHAPVLADLQPNSNTVETKMEVSPKKYPNPPQQVIKPVYAKKMTLYLTEELYRAFNNIYATRLLQGRPTEKSTLICEAISLLFEKEKNDGYI